MRKIAFIILFIIIVDFFTIRDRPNQFAKLPANNTELSRLEWAPFLASITTPGETFLHACYARMVQFRSRRRVEGASGQAKST